MKAELAGRVALVTGAGAKNGIGRTTALSLADAGADVAVTDITLSPELEELTSEIRSKGRRSAAVALNVMSSVEIRACVDAVARGLGGINILVNNAGTTVGALPFLDVSEADFDVSYFVNLRGPALLSQLCIPIMRAGGGGAIVNNVSTAGLGAEQGFGAYTASQHALIGLTKTI
ncbi:SDR family NAD(P)-dependent oxidoreductase, partial [Mesorhizobium sp. USDA-HM6]